MSGQAQARRGIVLSVGTIPELLNLRAEVLKSAGYDVISTTNPEQANFRMANEICDVLLLCYSLPDDWQKRLIESFRRDCPGGRVVAISNVPFARTPTEADQRVYGIEGPVALINAVRGKAA